MTRLEVISQQLKHGQRFVVVVAINERYDVISALLCISYNSAQDRFESKMISKADAISYIKSGMQFFTINLASGYAKDVLTPIYIVDGENAQYLRSDRNNEEEDNLGELPDATLFQIALKLNTKWVG